MLLNDGSLYTYYFYYKPWLTFRQSQRPPSVHFTHKSQDNILNFRTIKLEIHFPEKQNQRTELHKVEAGFSSKTRQGYISGWWCVQKGLLVKVFLGPVMMTWWELCAAWGLEDHSHQAWPLDLKFSWNVYVLKRDWSVKHYNYFVKK